MTSQQILAADLIDILFEHRNKSYGAYQLRKAYHKQLWKAVGIALGFAFFLVFFIQLRAVETVTKTEEGKEVFVEQVVPLPEKKKKSPHVQRQPQAAQVRQEKLVDQFKIVEKDRVDPVPTQEMLAKAAISNTTGTGVDVPAIQPPDISETKGEGTSAAVDPEPVKEVVPDKQPQFPGGAQAWLAFLSRYLQAPEPLESGEKRTVHIRFYVAEDGSITNFQVVRSAGAAFDNEVIRVLKKMPKWAPAMQGGHPVPVSFTQPVTFVGLEE